MPVIFIIENNQYAMGTALGRGSAQTELYRRGESIGIDGVQVDGMDVLAVKAAGDEAVAHVRAGKGPILMEMETYRYRGHSMSDPAKYLTLRCQRLDCRPPLSFAPLPAQMANS